MLIRVLEVINLIKGRVAYVTLSLTRVFFDEAMLANIVIAIHTFLWVKNQVFAV